ncbi:MAG: hypothetical protein IKT40_07405 [Bacilli bacterium]|nr:hypothetical protein [Bacilli bacterium]
MNKDLLKNKKFAQAQQQFMRLCEWSYVPQTLEEEGEDEMNQDYPQDDMNSNDGTNEPMGNEMPQNNGADNMTPMNNDPTMGDNMQDMPMDDTMTNDMPPMDNAPMMDEIPTDNETEDEEVIDVEELTDAQEKMNDKVNVVGQDLGDVSSKIESLLGILGNMEKMINNNNQEIEKFKAEFEKRNPTQTEKLNLRSLDSYPFNINPKDYWAEKGTDPNSNYSGESDNQKSTTQEYKITNNDVDDFNEREIENSFNIDDDFQQDLKKIFGF